MRRPQAKPAKRLRANSQKPRPITDKTEFWVYKNMDQLPPPCSDDDTGFSAKTFLKSVSRHPGVYRMFHSSGDLLYVGKAKNLKNRLSSYFRAQVDSAKTRALVERIARIEVTVTHSETEALLLEQNMIKQHRPPFNILLRDDKSYPYIYLSSRDEFPRLAFHRGSKRNKGDYFGPYPSSGAVRESLNLLQKVFGVRQCEDAFFRNRSRPCLQYQIERCSGPCVGLVDAEQYAADVKHVRLFLQGKSAELLSELIERMHAASEEMDYESAAGYRDKIAALKQVQAKQYVEGDEGDADVFGIAIQPGGACIHVLMVRGGRVIGSRNYYPKTRGELSAAAIFDEFVPQYYLGGSQSREVPPDIIVNTEFDAMASLADALTQLQERRIRVTHQVKTQRQAWLKLSLTNAQENLRSHLSNKQTLYQRFESLSEVLELEEPPGRIECFDISHTQGEGTVASCVVFDVTGPLKVQYRRFNIEGVQAGDDYGAMKQALTRRYKRLKESDTALPEMVLIDGGKGQLTQACDVMEELQITDVLLLGIAKGATRKPGLETLITPEQPEGFVLEGDSPALHLLQQIRDEAHRFAIVGHRARRAKKRSESPLEGIPGVGPKRRRQLLNYFGGYQEIERASIEDIAQVPKISKKMAEDIYAALHNV